MNKAAQELGRLAKGVPKTLTEEQRKFRSEQMAAARLKRHGKPKRIVRRSNVGVSDPAHKAHELQPERDGRVRSSPWFERPVNDLQRIGRNVKIILA